MTRKFPDERTAIVVIHGVGQQKPFETLDSFAANLVEYMRPLYGPFSLEHRIAERTGAGGSNWVESFLRIKPARGGSPVDIHEFYWAYLTENKITVPEVLDWVEKTLHGTRRFYRENRLLQQRFEKRRGSSFFPLTWVAWVLRLITAIYPLYRLARFVLLPALPLLQVKWVVPVLHWIERNTAWVIVGYIGDVAIYTSTDEKSDNFRIRQQIMKECQGLVEGILQDKKYERVILAGHSLGSVIAYDTLNRINIKANTKSGSKLPIRKLRGLVTFGSPLDKIAFFFREHTKESEFIRRQIRAHLHSFKAKPLDLQENREPLANPIKHKLDGMPWVNYFSREDPISGHLDFYVIPEEDNVLLDIERFWGVAHVGYWTHPPFYEDIAKRFL